MPARRPNPDDAAYVTGATRALDAGEEPPREALRSAVRYLLLVLAETVPGKAVEVRVPPVAAVQCIPGVRHTRGPPPNVVETDPVTWIRLATGRLDWAAAVATGQVQASGSRSDLSPFLPVGGPMVGTGGEGDPKSSLNWKRAKARRPPDG